MLEELRVEPLLLCVGRSQLRLLRHLVRIPPRCLPGDVFQSCPTGKRPRGRPEIISLSCSENTLLSSQESWRRWQESWVSCSALQRGPREVHWPPLPLYIWKALVEAVFDMSVLGYNDTLPGRCTTPSVNREGFVCFVFVQLCLNMATHTLCLSTHIDPVHFYLIFFYYYFAQWPEVKMLKYLEYLVMLMHHLVNSMWTAPGAGLVVWAGAAFMYFNYLGRERRRKQTLVNLKDL